MVVDNDARLKDRVKLPFENVDRYDSDYYCEQLIRACESVLSPLEWQQEDIGGYLRGNVDAQLSVFE